MLRQVIWFAAAHWLFTAPGSAIGFGWSVEQRNGTGLVSSWAIAFSMPDWTVACAVTWSTRVLVIKNWLEISLMSADPMIERKAMMISSALRTLPRWDRRLLSSFVMDCTPDPRSRASARPRADRT